MSYNFFADKEDKLQIIDFIFRETDLRIFDHSSPSGEDIREYFKVEEIADKFELHYGGRFAACFQLWSPNHGSRPLFRKINLDPKKCKGHTFRYSTDGWGLIQLYFGGVESNGLNQSHIGHFNRKEAAKNESITHFNGRVNDWNWTEIEKTSRKLKNHIHNSLAIRKIGSVGVLLAAERLVNHEIQLI